MVEVSLLELVGIANTRPVWPEQFRDLVAACEANPDERTTFGVVADWCDEHGESGYGRAWRWLSKRPWDDEKQTGVRVQFGKDAWHRNDWSYTNVPPSMVSPARLTADITTLAGLVTGIAKRLIEIDKETDA